MKKLITGLRDFKTNYYSSHQDLFEQLTHGQTPRVLFITCSDSRIVPNLMTNTDVGDIFVIRNAGNIIPPYGAANGGEGAAVEYAIHALGIQQIIVCGHSHCGAMKGLLKRESLEAEMPLVCEWLKHAEATRRLIRDNYSHYEGEELLEVTVAENVLTQIENLQTYPIVHSRLHQGTLKIYGWVYYLETAEVLAYDAESHSYVVPQSQLPREEQGNSISNIITNAPPVACELPSSYTLESAAMPSTRPSQPKPKIESTPVAPLAMPWLSQEQAERIYRGSTRSH